MSTPAAADYVIVGAGAAGCVLADRLSATGASVLVVEAGPSDRALPVRIPAAFATLFGTERDWAFRTADEPGLDGRSVYWPRGRTVGGSTSINAQMYVRGLAVDFDGWAAMTGDDGWGYEALLPRFRRLERNSRGASPYHGDKGRLCVSDLHYHNPLTGALLAAAEEVGIPATDDVNGPCPDGVTRTQVTQRRGRRHSAADAFLGPALRRGVRLVTDALAEAVEFDGDRATGVRIRTADHSELVRAHREVLLAAGAVGTPHLLLRSGIGPAAELRRLGIGVVAELPGVGQNMQDHPAAIVRADVTTPASLLTARSLPNLVRFLLFGRGPLTSNVAEGLAFVRTRPELPAPDLELLFAPVHFVGEGLEPPTTHGVSIGAVALQPASTGSIALSGPDPAAPPVIRAGYLSDPGGTDLAVLRHGVDVARRILAAPALARHGAVEVVPGPGADVDTFIRSVTQSLYHPVGTCRMGSGPDAVVDSALRVHSVHRLRVVDASVMPRIVRGHTQAATMVIAERAAEMITGAPAG